MDVHVGHLRHLIARHGRDRLPFQSAFGANNQGLKPIVQRALPSEWTIVEAAAACKKIVQNEASRGSLHDDVGSQTLERGDVQNASVPQSQNTEAAR